MIFINWHAEEEDRFILCSVHRLGYGAWDELKAEIRKSWRFRFDWFFKSRTPQVGNPLGLGHQDSGFVDRSDELLQLAVGVCRLFLP